MSSEELFFSVPSVLASPFVTLTSPLLVPRIRREEQVMRDELTRSEESRRSIESELAGTKEVIAWNLQALANSLERSMVLKEELGRLRVAARSVVTEVLGPRLGSSALVDDLSEVPGEVAGLITDEIFHGTSRVLTLVASHHPTLAFEAVGRGYAVGWSVDQLRELGQSLVPVAMVIMKATTTEWVREARLVERVAALGKDGGQSMEAESCAARTEPAPRQRNPPVDPAVWLLPSASSVNTDEMPQ
jgi:hypothetical protein